MTYTDLIERLEEGDGPDRELDAAIVVALIPDTNAEFIPATQEGCIPGEYLTLHGHVPHSAPRLTISLDACAALQAEVLPGWLWEKHWNGREHSIVLLPGPDWPEYKLPRIGGHLTSETRAHLIAILRAKEAQGK